MIVEVQGIDYTPGDTVGVASGTLQGHPDKPVTFGVDHRYVEGMIDALEQCGGSLPCQVEGWQVLSTG